MRVRERAAAGALERSGEPAEPAERLAEPAERSDEPAEPMIGTPGGAPGSGAIVLVTAVGGAEGARPLAAALACAAAGGESAPLLIDLEGRAPRPTLIATVASRRLEERLATHLPHADLAARGQFCQIAVAADEDGFLAASAAATVARGAAVVVHAGQGHVRELLEANAGPRTSAVLLRATLPEDRALLALAVRDLLGRGLGVAVLKHRLSWVAERRALFGALTPAQTGLPAQALRLLQPEQQS